MFEIEKDIPVPEVRRHSQPKYPWRDMNVGDSFFVPGRTTHQMGSKLASGRRSTGFRFTSRKVDGGVRVWRVE